MHDTKTVSEARRMMQICNACRYCEGYCAVFPAMELRRTFTSGDLSYLANLCHDCRGCYYACQYAPPHEFALNLPQTLSRLRAESYSYYAWPGRLAGAFTQSGSVVAVMISLCLALVLALASLLQSPDILFQANSEPGAFYAVIPAAAMIGVAGATFGFALLAMAVGALHFWRHTGGGAPRMRPLLHALWDVLTLRNLGGGGHGCNDRDESFSRARRYSHQTLFYGFFLCFASTCTAAFYEHFLGLLAPYPLLSWPVLLGAFGGAGMMAGAAGLLWVKAASDPVPAAKALMGADYALLWLLILSAASGLVLLVLRDSRAMGILLAFHLGFILAFFLVMPYSKFVHGVYRSAALLRHAAERPEHS